MTASSPVPLCASLDTTLPHGIVWQKQAGRWIVALRPVRLHNDEDLNIIHQWISQYFTADQPVDQLRLIYTLIAESGYAQSYLVLLEEEIPVCQVEIYEAGHDAIEAGIAIGPGYYCIYFPVIPMITDNMELPVSILTTCLEYFFSYREVEKILWTVLAADKDGNALAIRSGFRLWDTFFEKTGAVRQRMNLYWIDQEQVEGNRQ